VVRKNIPDPVTNRLFALSGNQCAFPSCLNTVTDQVAPGEQPVTLAQRAHIVGVGHQGPRSKATPLSDDIDAVENLLLSAAITIGSLITTPASSQSKFWRSTRPITWPRWRPRISGRSRRPWRPTQSTFRSCQSPNCPQSCGGPSRRSGRVRRSLSTCTVEGRAGPPVRAAEGRGMGVS
jgi:hypothetical protein